MNQTVNRSSITLNVRMIPYLLWPARPLSMIDRHFARLCAEPFHQHADEPMHLAVETQLIRQFAAIRFQRAAQIMQPRSGYSADEEVGDTRREYDEKQSILPIRARPHTKSHSPSSMRSDHRRNIGGVVLSVCVHRNDHPPGRVPKTRIKRGRLPVVLVAGSAREVRFLAASSCNSAPVPSTLPSSTAMTS